MKASQSILNDRVRKVTSKEINDAIDQNMEENIRRYASADSGAIRERIQELSKEWDIDRALELNASLIALTGILLAATVHKKWLVLPALVTGFLALHALQGWCPPVPLMRKLRIRTQKEIEAEIHALLRKLDK